MKIDLPPPIAQIEFARMLAEIRSLYLQDALASTIEKLAIPEVDKELAIFAPAEGLKALATHALRGEIVFPVPMVLHANPRVLAYYRLLYGYSQKEFYGSATGVGRFKGMEERGAIAQAIAHEIPNLAGSLCKAGALLLSGIGAVKITRQFFDDLTLLTLGPQLRGGANVRKGAAGIQTVFNAIHEIVAESVTASTPARIEIMSARGQKVFIEFAPDPDIIVREEMRPNVFREVIAIEVKAGADFSNIHNRIGEAEKSHQKAKDRGYVECWTVVNVDKIDLAIARKESPSTNRFYRISALIARSGGDYQDFKDRLSALTGIRVR